MIDRHRLKLPLLAMLAIALCLATAATAAQNAWDQIYLDGPIVTTLADGSVRTLEPSCSGGPVPTPGGPMPADTQYYFFVQKGNPNKLLIGLDGGGACWDAATCIGSPLAGSSTYTQALDETPDRLEQSEGLFDARNPDNPFHNYTKIFIPYCTGDVHWGSKDTTYSLEVAPGVVVPWTIHHRGADNVLAVLDWLQRYGREQYQIDFGRARHVTVAGASAGGYGANVAFPYFASLTPRARLSMISDASIGVINDSFYRNAVYDPANPGSESWNVAGNLPAWVPGFDMTLLAQGAAFPMGFVPSVFAVVAQNWPDAHLASLTTNLDLVQVFFYGLMKGVVPPDAVTAGEWYLGMKAITSATAMLPNYRYFIDDGVTHTFIGDDDLFYGVGVNGISIADWVRAMVKPGERVWENLDAGPP